MPILVIKLKRMGRIVSSVLVATAAMLVVLVYPMLLLLFSVGVFALLVLSRHLNFYKMVMMLKRYARSATKLRSEVRARIHLGFRDCSNVSFDGGEEFRCRTHGYVR